MKTLRNLLGFLLLALILLSGCKQSNDVVSKGWLQKRKYRPGFHLNLGKNQPSSVVAVKSDSKKQAHTLSGAINPQKLPRLNTYGQGKATLTHGSKPSSLKSRVSKEKKPKTVELLLSEAEDEPEEVDHEREGKKSKKKGILATLIGAAGIIYGSYSVIFSSFLSFFFSPVLLLTGPIALGLGLIAMTIGIIYLIDAQKRERGETVFTDRFREIAGKVAFYCGIATFTISILSGLALGAIYILAVAALGDFAILIAPFLSIYLLFQFMNLFAFLSWPTITGVWFSFKHGTQGKRGFILWLIPFVLIMILAALVLLF